MILEVEHLSKRYAGRTAVQDLNLRLEDGEIFGMVGPNGAGKTTAIRMVLGLVRPDSGRALVAGHDSWSQHVEAARHLGAVMEAPGLYPALTALQNLRQRARFLPRVPRGELARLLGVVGLTDRADEPVRRFSLGMRQRLALALALLGGPELLILDEPTNGLDPLGIQELRELLKGLSRSQGVTIFLSSHLLAEVEELCDRIAILSHGFTRAQGRLSELINGHGFQLELWSADAERARRVLATIPGLEVGAGSSRERLALRSDLDLSEVVISRLVAAGVGVRELRRTGRHLEDYFREVTLRGTESAAPAGGA